MIRHTKALAALCAGAVFALAGCGNDPEANAALRFAKELGTTMANRVKGGEQAAGGAGITRAQLEQFNSPMIMVRVPAMDMTSFFVPYGQNGGVETWASPDNRTISFRQGVMVATRGFGPDIMQSAGPSAAQLAAGSGSHKRIYDYLDGADQNLRREFVCTVRNAGAETITVVDRQHTTRHVIEECAGNGVEFTNEYWFEGGSFIRKSKQLIVPEWGYFDIQRVVDKG